jgi:tripartite-type tricarboxylate transporter receptor subunit TctC
MPVGWSRWKNGVHTISITEENMLKVLSAVTALVGATALAILPAKAQEWPTKQPVKIVISSAAGGLTDALARVTAEFLQQRLKQAVVVEPRTGAGGTIGAAYVASQPADGYTIFLAGAEQAISPAVRPTLPYKFEDFTFLVQPFRTMGLIATRPDLPVKDIPELVAYMKENPGKARYGSTGVGAIVHMGTLMFEQATGTKGVHVPYQGIAPIYPDLLAGNVDFVIGASYPFPEGLKIIGGNGPARSPLYPDLKTLEESGIQGATWFTWFGFLAPPDLPTEIAERLNKEIVAVVTDPVAIAKFQEVTKSVPDEKPLVGQEFKDMALKAVEDWKVVAKANNIVIQE